MRIQVFMALKLAISGFWPKLLNRLKQIEIQNLPDDALPVKVRFTSLS